MRVLKQYRCADGDVRFWQHDSVTTNTPMKFSTFTPPGEVRGALIWLSGLSCTDENFMAKAGAQRYFAQHGLMVICPDTSPRGLNLADEHTSYDFGSGAGFYVNATTDGYRDHYLMYDYVTAEIYEILQTKFAMQDHISIAGHSMGGHGALMMALREPQKFRSVSAFSPIVNPTLSPWGEKAFTGYLGDDRANWSQYDACALLSAGQFHPTPLLIDQGDADEFLANQLLTGKILEAAKTHDRQTIELRMRTAYDHSYYFIASFIESHIAHHARYLN